MHTLIPFLIKKTFTWLGTLVLLSLCDVFKISNCKTIFWGLTSCLPKKKSTAYLMANMKSAWKMKKRMVMDPFFFLYSLGNKLFSFYNLKCSIYQIKIVQTYSLFFSALQRKTLHGCIITAPKHVNFTLTYMFCFSWC